MPTPKQLANLRPWQPGESGNPSGRSGAAYSAVVFKQLEAALQDERDGKTRIAHIIEKVVSLAEQGRPWAVKMVLDRMLPATHPLDVDVHGLSAAEREREERDSAQFLEKVHRRIDAIRQEGIEEGLRQRAEADSKLPAIPAELTAKLPEQ